MISKLTLPIVLIFAVGACCPVNADLLFSASLMNGNYGGGTAINTYPLPGSAPALQDQSDGVVFLPSEGNGQSNGLINYQLGPANHSSFRAHGTFSVDIKADRQNFVAGHIASDNFGFNQFGNGQSSIALSASRQANGPGLDDDKLVVSWQSWNANVWYSHGSTLLDFGQWYDIGFAWYGPNNRYELWVNGMLKAVDNTSPATPWGSPFLGLGSAYNFGLGDNHMRGVDGYHSPSHLTFANLAIWNEYRLYGDSTAVPEPSTIGLLGLAVGLTIIPRLRNRGAFIR